MLQNYFQRAKKEYDAAVEASLCAKWAYCWSREAVYKRNRTKLYYPLSRSLFHSFHKINRFTTSSLSCFFNETEDTYGDSVYFYRSRDVLMSGFMWRQKAKLHVPERGDPKWATENIFHTEAERTQWKAADPKTNLSLWLCECIFHKPEIIGREVHIIHLASARICICICYTGRSCIHSVTMTMLLLLIPYNQIFCLKGKLFLQIACFHLIDLRCFSELSCSSRSAGAFLCMYCILVKKYETYSIKTPIQTDWSSSLDDFQNTHRHLQ